MILTASLYSFTVVIAAESSEIHDDFGNLGGNENGVVVYIVVQLFFISGDFCEEDAELVETVNTGRIPRDFPLDHKTDCLQEIDESDVLGGVLNGTSTSNCTSKLTVKKINHL